MIFQIYIYDIPVKMFWFWQNFPVVWKEAKQAQVAVFSAMSAI